jgi:hypothetical protein
MPGLGSIVKFIGKNAGKVAANVVGIPVASIAAVLDAGASSATVSEYIDELKFAPKATGAGDRIQVKIYNGNTNWLAWMQREEFERITGHLAQHNQTRANQPAVFKLDDGEETTISSIQEFRPKK